MKLLLEIKDVLEPRTLRTGGDDSKCVCLLCEMQGHLLVSKGSKKLVGKQGAEFRPQPNGLWASVP